MLARRYPIIAVMVGAAISLLAAKLPATEAAAQTNPKRTVIHCIESAKELGSVAGVKSLLAAYGFHSEQAADFSFTYYYGKKADTQRGKALTALVDCTAAGCSQYCLTGNGAIIEINYGEEILRYDQNWQVNAGKKWAFTADEIGVQSANFKSAEKKGKTSIDCDFAQFFSAAVSGEPVVTESCPERLIHRFRNRTGNTVDLVLRTPNDQQALGYPIGAIIGVTPDESMIAFSNGITCRDLKIRPPFPSKSLLQDSGILSDDPSKANKAIPLTPDVNLPLWDAISGKRMLWKHRFRDKLGAIHNILEENSAFPLSEQGVLDKVQAVATPGEYLVHIDIMSFPMDYAMNDIIGRDDITDIYVRGRVFQALFGPEAVETMIDGVMVLLNGNFADERTRVRLIDMGFRIGTTPQSLYKLLASKTLEDLPTRYSALAKSHWNLPLTVAETQELTNWLAKVNDNEVSPIVVQAALRVGLPIRPDDTQFNHWYKRYVLERASVDRVKLLALLSLTPAGRQLLKAKMIEHKTNTTLYAESLKELKRRVTATMEYQRYDFISREECEQTLLLLK